MMLRIAIILVCLAGCGGSGGGTAARVDYSTFHQSVVDLGVVSYALLPERGTLDYTGQMSLNLPLGAAPETYIGTFGLSIDLDGTDLDAAGQVTGLQSASGTQLGGSLTVDGGQMFPNADPQRDFLFTADLSGALEKSGTDYVLTAKLQGDFFGNDAEGVAGVVFAGQIREGSNVDIFDGSFAGMASP